AAVAHADGALPTEPQHKPFIAAHPDGVEDRRITSDGGALGGHHVPLELQQTAMLGSWTLRIHSDPDASPIAQSVFLVEEFVPDRIEFDLEPETPEIDAGEPAWIALDGRYLYGAPASNLELEGEVVVSARREWDRFPGFSFGLADEEIEASSTSLDVDETGENGKARIEVATDALPSTTGLLEARATVRMRENGGRAVERSTTLAIRPQDTVIGIRPDFAGSEVQQGSTPAFRAFAVSPAGEREALTGALWTLTTVERNERWYRSNNSWN